MFELFPKFSEFVWNLVGARLYDTFVISCEMTGASYSDSLSLHCTGVVGIRFEVSECELVHASWDVACYEISRWFSTFRYYSIAENLWAEYFECLAS